MLQGILIYLYLVSSSDGQVVDRLSKQYSNLGQPLSFSNVADSDDASPYWSDIEGRKPNSVPSLSLDVLQPNIPCLPTEYPACSRNEIYRRVDGSCNNLFRPKVGARGDELARLAQPQYDNNVLKMFGKQGNYLPNPRVISRQMQNMRKGTARPNTNVFWIFFGQFVDHDLTSVPVLTDKNNPKKPFDCKPCRSWTDQIACMPILVPRDDGRILGVDPASGKRNCLSFTRSQATTSYANGQFVMKPINENTAFLDLSPVYGSDTCAEQKVRLNSQGCLTETVIPGQRKGMLPIDVASNFGDCRSVTGKCAITGDFRGNENLALMVYHILFVREHNRLATMLAAINPHWNDERIYQEARKINIAQYQRLVYEEFLPVLVGGRLASLNDLQTQARGSSLYHEGYNDNTNPRMLIEFTTACFRYGHTLLPNDIIFRDSFYMPVKSLPLTELLQNSTLMFEDGINSIAYGTIGTRIEPFDPILEDSLANKLFIKSGPLTAADLLSLNIARGRDHGMPGYTTYRKLCGFGEVTSWNDLPFHPENIYQMRRVYTDVHDIDLFVGGLSEDRIDDAVVGPTFACIISQQFHNLKKGDRFWFENRQHGFSPEQLNAIKEGSVLQRLLAFNLDDIQILPFQPFELPDATRNSLLYAANVPDINLQPWKEPPPRKIDDTLSCYFNGAFAPSNSYINISLCLKCLCRGGKVRCDPFSEGCGYQRDPQDESCRLICGSSHQQESIQFNLL